VATTAVRDAEVLGLRTTVGAVDDAADAVVRRARERVGGYGVLCNVHVLMTASDDEDVRDALENATWAFADGAPIAWLQRRGGDVVAERVTGADLMWRVLEEGRAHGLRHALLGSTPRVLDSLRERIQTLLPDVEIVGAISPSFASGAADTADVMDALVASRPDVVWCALGAPKQELWMRRHAERLAPAILLGVGAAFDFHAGTKARAPKWMQRVGLEWLHRLASEPRRLGGRYMRTNTGFVVSLARGSWRNE
jgi:N-acetylglucosaminyldiphosphoundecaprenol N-acetyl-beta-D-mannosaminyltransferase